jgi:hypothetical protein
MPSLITQHRFLFLLHYLAILFLAGLSQVVMGALALPARFLLPSTFSLAQSKPPSRMYNSPASTKTSSLPPDTAAASLPSLLR